MRAHLPVTHIEPSHIVGGPPRDRDLESALRARGYVAVAGIDEVGRGTLAGPVVAAAVILPARLSGDWVRLVRDSKQLTARQRERVFDPLTDAAVSHAVGAATASEIDEIGIVAATRRAMARAVDALDAPPDYLLIDALDLPALPIPQAAMAKADARFRCVAAASIIAKVTRDRLMAGVFERMYPGYGFASHKGYCTPAHVDALRRLGPCPGHRQTFAPVRAAAERQG